MRHLSVLLSAQGASKLQPPPHPHLPSTCAAVLKTATPAKTRLIRGIATTPLFRCVCARRPLLPSHVPAQSPGEWLPDYLSPQAGRRFKCSRTGSGHFGLGSPRNG